MNSKNISRLVVLAGTLALTGCTQGFSAVSSLTGSTNSSSSTGTTSPSASAAFKSLSVDGTVSGYDNVQVIEIDKTNMMLIVRLPTPIPALTYATTNTPIAQIPGASLSVESLSGGGSALVLRLPLSAVIKGVALSSPTTLPNGDPLPGVPDGELPSVAVTLSKVGSINPTIYLSPSVVGIFVNSPYSLPISVTLPIKNAAGTRTWGYVSSIPVKGTDKGGFFVSIALPDDIARAIDDVL